MSSFTVITLPSHSRFSHIHPKNIPVMLRPEDFDLWLDPDFHYTDALAHLMKTHIPAPLVFEPVRSTKDLKPVAKGEVLPAGRRRLSPVSWYDLARFWGYIRRWCT